MATEFDSIRHLLAPPEPETKSTSSLMLIHALQKYAEYRHNEMKDLLPGLTAAARKSVRSVSINIADSIYNLIPEDKRS